MNGNIIPDVLKLIFGLLDITDLGNIASVSKEWAYHSASDDVWNIYSTKFNVSYPNLKLKIKNSLTNLDQIFDAIKKKMYTKNYSAFFCEFVQLLFGDNIRRIKVEHTYAHTYIRGHNKYWFILALKKERWIYFNNTYIYNFYIPKKVAFSIEANGLKFDNYFDYTMHYPIQINRPNIGLSTRYCQEIFLSWWDDVYVYYTQDNEINKCMVSTNKGGIKGLLNSVLFIKEF